MDIISVYILISIAIYGVNGLYRHSNSACYGNHNNFITASCPENNGRVLLDKVYVYAKPMNTSCPVQSNSNTPASCCHAETGDCGFEYDGESKHIYFQNCVGRTTCSWSRAAWSDIMLPCTTSVHRSQSSYMTAYYYCISDQAIQDVTKDTTVTEPVILLKNPGYESGNITGTLPANSSFTCSVSAPCDTPLQVRSMNLNFTKESGVCGQTLTITDGTKTRVLTCDNNTDYLPADLDFGSNTNYIEIQVNNTSDTDAGYFLLQLGGVNTLGNVTLNCGSSVGRKESPDCSNVTTVAPTTSTTDTTVTPPTTITDTTVTPPTTTTDTTVTPPTTTTDTTVTPPTTTTDTTVTPPTTTTDTTVTPPTTTTGTTVTPQTATTGTTVTPPTTTTDTTVTPPTTTTDTTVTPPTATTVTPQTTTAGTTVTPQTTTTGTTVTPQTTTTGTTLTPPTTTTGTTLTPPTTTTGTTVNPQTTTTGTTLTPPTTTTGTIVTPPTTTTGTTVNPPTTTTGTTVTGTTVTPPTTTTGTTVTPPTTTTGTTVTPPTTTTGTTVTPPTTTTDTTVTPPTTTTDTTVTTTTETTVTTTTETPPTTTTETPPTTTTPSAEEDETIRANGLYRHSNSACYGNHNNFIHASCPENNERVLLDKLYVYAKPMNTSCPVQSNSNTPASCCQAETGDCGFEYDGESKHIYFQNCVGRTTCSWSRAAWSNIMLPCTTSVHRSQSSYMTAYYYCISDQAIQDVTKDTTVTEPVILLKNPGYESGNITGTLPANSSFTCSVSAPCDTPLQVRSMNLNFTKESGVCGQTLTITDGTKTRVLTCDNNTDYLPADLDFGSNTNYIEIQVNNTLDTDAGYFLLQLGGVNTLGNVTLNCGSSVGRKESPDCSNVTTVAPTTSTTDTTVTPPTTITDTTVTPPTTTTDTTVTPPTTTTDTTVTPPTTTTDTTVTPPTTTTGTTVTPQTATTGTTVTPPTTTTGTTVTPPTTTTGTTVTPPTTTTGTTVTPPTTTTDTTVTPPTTTTDTTVTTTTETTVTTTTETPPTTTTETPPTTTTPSAEEDETIRANSLYRHSNSACYGNHNNFITASCPENNERVLLDKLYVYAKPMNTSCPVQSNSNTPASCCQAETGDCGFEYDGESKHIYFQNCVGRTTCSWSRAAWSNIMLPCTTSVHRSQSSYMTAYYYCISDQAIQDVTKDTTVTEPVILLKNPGYESGNITGTLPAKSSFTCSVSAPCDTPLQVRSMNLNFTKESGVCGQTLTITDGTKTRVLTCDNNTDFLPADLDFGSNTNYIEIQVNNTLDTDAGYFLLQLGGGNTLGNVTLNCGSSVGRKEFPDCSNVTTVAPTTSTTDTTVTPPTTITDTTVTPPTTTTDITVTPPTTTTDTTVTPPTTTTDTTVTPPTTTTDTTVTPQTTTTGTTVTPPTTTTDTTVTPPTTTTGTSVTPQTATTGTTVTPQTTTTGTTVTPPTTTTGTTLTPPTTTTGTTLTPPTATTGTTVTPQTTTTGTTVTPQTTTTGTTVTPPTTTTGTTLTPPTTTTGTTLTPPTTTTDTTVTPPTTTTGTTLTPPTTTTDTTVTPPTTTTGTTVTPPTTTTGTTVTPPTTTTGTTVTPPTTTTGTTVTPPTTATGTTVTPPTTTTDTTVTPPTTTTDTTVTPPTTTTDTTVTTTTETPPTTTTETPPTTTTPSPYAIDTGIPEEDETIPVWMLALIVLLSLYAASGLVVLLVTGFKLWCTKCSAKTHPEVKQEIQDLQEEREHLPVFEKPALPQIAPAAFAFNPQVINAQAPPTRPSTLPAIRNFRLVPRTANREAV